MPLPKRRKLSLNEQDGKEGTRNRLATGDGKSGKRANSDANANKAPATQADRRPSRHDRKTEATTSTTTAAATAPNEADDGRKSSRDSLERVSSSGRIIKQTKKGIFLRLAQTVTHSKQSASGTTKANKTGTPVRGKKKKKRRPWEVWSKFEQDTFFEGLFEYGKDFDAIQNLIYHRSKKHGVEASLIKRKDQVRHMYYRTWQKIAKHVHMDEEVKKETQELYGLVNYAIFRKAFKSLNERTAVHLIELIHNGVSKVKRLVYGKKKKNITKYLRTPICNALKKLNNIEDTKDEVVEVPQQVTVEITPRNTTAWLRVHNLSQNPRVRFHLSANRSLASIMEHLRKKWIGVEDRVRRSIAADEDESEELVFFPHHGYTLTPVTITSQRATSVDMIALSSYRENILDSPVSGGKASRRSVDDPKLCSDNSSDAEAVEASADPQKPRRVGVKVSLFQKTSEPFPPCDDENAMFPDTPLSSSPPKEMSCTDSKCPPAADASSEDHVISVTNCDNENQRPATPMSDASPHSKDKRDLRDEERETDMRQLIETALKGFTRESSRLVTLAQLSLLLQRTSHVRLEYEWRTKKLLTSGNILSTTGVAEKEPVTNMLRRLGNLATLEYRDTTQRMKMAAGGRMAQCTLCGHQLERPVVNRRKTTSDASTETDPLSLETVETLVPGVVNILRPTKLNSNGTIVGMSTNFVDKESLTPDRDGVFRVPMPVPVPMVRCSSQQRMSTQPTFSQLIRPPEPRPAKNFLIPRKRKQPRKPIIVQRTLLPKMPTGQVILLPQNLPAGNIIEQTVISQSTAAISADMSVAAVTPVSSTVLAAVTPVTGLSITPVTGTVSATVTSEEQIHRAIPSIAVSEVLNESTSDLFASNISLPDGTATSTPTKSAEQLTHSSVSPPYLSSFLDISLSASSNQGADAGDKFLDMVLVNGNTDFTGFLKSPAKGNVSDSAVNNNTLSTPPHSPRVSPLKMGADTQWLGGDAPDISLGSLLDTPIKKCDAGDGGATGGLGAGNISAITSTFLPAPPALFGENSQDSIVAKLDVDTALQSVMTESSIDYSTKFEHLAAHLADNTDSTQTGI